jgi:hypothetical protein
VETIKYTRHGKRRAAERGISEKLILKAITEPTYAYYDLSGAEVFTKEVAKRWVRAGHEVTLFTSELPD